MKSNFTKYDATIADVVPLAPQDSDALGRVSAGLAHLDQLSEELAAADCGQSEASDLALPKNFKLSVVIPVYNEVRTIEQVVRNVAALPVPKEIIVVDDASTDGTREVLGELEASLGILVVVKPRNEGKGAALRTGFHRVSGDVVVVQDADLEYDPRDILAVIKPIVQGQADAVFGSRYMATKPQDHSLLHRAINRFLTAASNWTTGLAITDMETCYKAFRKEVLQSFEICQPRFGFEPEVTAKLARRKYRVCEVPIRYRPRGYAEGKKIGVADLFNALYCIARYAIRD